MIEVFTFSEPGGHAENEDAYDLRPISLPEECYLCAVADGQGGRPGGAQAARVACRACLDAALTYPLANLFHPDTWADILRAADEAVCDDPTAGFTTLVGFCVSGSFVCGASSGDSAAVLFQAGRAGVVLTAHQQKNPPVGSRAASFVSFCARLVAPWTLLAMSDGVWKYAGLTNVMRIASEERGQEIIPAIREQAELRPSGRLQDDFTLVVLQSGKDSTIPR